MNKYLKTSLIFLILAILVAFFAAAASGSNIPLPSELKLLKAINKVEASGVRDGKILGDNGKALGPFQIHRIYWQDAHEFDKSLGGKYEDCQHWDYSVRVVHSYWRRYAPEALRKGDYETLSRVHNGGPNGTRKPATLSYWRKVQIVLDKELNFKHNKNMATPTKKAPEIESFINSTFGVNRRVSIKSDTCVSCNHEAKEFKDALSRKEFTISGLCQKCQDSVFGAPDSDI